MVTRARVLRLAAALLLGVLGACGSSSGSGYTQLASGAGPEYGRELFPTTSGRRLVYTMAPVVSSEYRELLVASSRPTDDGDLVTTIDGGWVVGFIANPVFARRWVVADDGVYLLGPHAFQDVATGGVVEEWLDPPLVFLAFPLSAGMAYESQTGTMRLHVEVVGVERVTVPAGDFDTVRIETKNLAVELSGPYDELDCPSTWWFAAGVGLVRRTIRAPGTDGLTPVDYHLELLEVLEP